MDMGNLPAVIRQFDLSYSLASFHLKRPCRSDVVRLGDRSRELLDQRKRRGAVRVIREEGRIAVWTVAQ